MFKVLKYFLLIGLFELGYLFLRLQDATAYIGLSETLFTIGVLQLLLALSFFFGVERKLSLFQISGKSAGLKEALNASLMEQLGDKSKNALLDYPLGFAFLGLALINLIGYFILL